MSKLSLDRSKFSASIKTVQKQTRSLGGWVKKNSAQFKGMGLAIAAMGTAALLVFKKMVKQYMEVGDMIHKMALRTGFAAETLSELAYAADISGADITMLEKGVKKMSKTIVDASYGLETYLRVFRSLGLDIEDLMKLTPEEQFLKLGAAIADMENQTLKTAAAVDVFGRAGTMLLPLFAEGAEGIAKLREEAHTLGIIFDEEAAAKAAKLKDAQTALKGSVQGLSIAILNDLIPVITSVTKQFTDFFVSSREGTKTWTVAILGAFQFIAKGIETLMLAWQALKTAVFAVGIAAVESLILTAKAFKLIAELSRTLTFGFKLIKAENLDQHIKDLTAVSEGYREEVGAGIDTMTDIIVKYEAFVATLNKVKTGTEKAKKEQKSFGETIEKALMPLTRPLKLGPLAVDIPKMSLEDFKKFYTKWLKDLQGKWVVAWQNMMDFSRYLVEQLSAIFSQFSMGQMQRIDNEYEARRTSIENSLMDEEAKAIALEKLEKETDKKRRKAMRTQAIFQKAISLASAVINMAEAITKALTLGPFLGVAAATWVKILGAVQIAAIIGTPIPSMAEGGEVASREPVIVGERGPELWTPARAGTISPLRGEATTMRMRIIIQNRITIGETTFRRETVKAVNKAGPLGDLIIPNKVVV